ncbi:MAG: hypothetical protein SFV20_05330 [Sphingopyxis sp.]|nr:hypothetical protein [Sphingopyxis sp.]
MSVIGQIAFFGALAIIAFIGLDLLVRQPGQRGDRTGIREPLPEGVDPASLRRRTPQAQRLTGAVLILAALTILGVVRRSL